MRLAHISLGILDELGYQGLNLSEGSALAEDADEEGLANSIGRCDPDSDDNALDFSVMLASPGTENFCR